MSFDPHRYKVDWESVPATNEVHLVMDVPISVAKEYEEEIQAYLDNLLEHAGDLMQSFHENTPPYLRNESL